MCWRKLIKLGLYIKFMNFLMMNIRSIKYEQIFVPICTVNIDAPIRITWTAKTRTSPLLLQLGTPARFCTVRVSQKYKKIPSKKLSNKDWKTGVQCGSRSSLAESAILKYVGLGVTADPAGSNSIWRMFQSTQSPLIVISYECTNLYHTVFLF